MVLTDEVNPASVYQATMEDANRSFEDQLFNNIDGTVTSNNKPTGFDGDGTNHNVSQLFSTSASDKRIGPGIVLKVMAGDKFNAKVYGWYNPTGMNMSTYSGATAIVTALINAMTGGLISAGSKGTSTELSDPSGVLSSPLTSFTSSQPYNSSQPKAYLNWMILDAEQFKLVQGSYGAVQIPAITGTMQKQLMQSNGGTDITITKNGYLYVYVSNESQGSVYFDDLRVEHIKGPIQEETHYYPFGLTMAGISDQAAGGLENKYKYNRKELQHGEFNDGSGLDMYDFGAREQDPQTGRWTTIDPSAQRRCWATPYNYVQNNPINLYDPTGLTDYTLNKKTGDINEVKGTETKDGPDRIVKSKVNKKGEVVVKYKRNGKARVAIGGIEKGILKDGINFQKNDNIVAVGAEGQPSVGGVKSFTLQLSEYVGKEIKGFSYSSNGSGKVTDMVLGKYEVNNNMESFGSPYALLQKYGNNFSLNNVVQEFHTHPNGELGATESDPQLSTDVQTLQNDKPQIPNASFIILYRVTGQTKPAEYDYTFRFIPKKNKN